MLSVKDNFLRLLRREVPEYVSNYNIFWGLRGPSVYRAGRNQDGTGKDMFGVEWVIDGSAIQASIPKPGDFVLDDIRKWRDVIKVMDLSDVDWEAMAKKDMETRDPEMPWGGNTVPTVGFFQALMSYMGFTEGLVACFEEPEEVKALMEYLTDYSVENAKKYIQYYKPDFGMLADDIAHERNPFVSLPMFRELFAPAWKRYGEAFLEEGLPLMHHNCGHFEEFLGDLVEMGYSGWDPVQDSNDLIAIKNKFGNNLALCGGWIGKRPSIIPDGTTEEEVRASVKLTLDTLATGGGFAFTGGGGNSEDPAIQERIGWVRDEFEKLRYSYYK